MASPRRFPRVRPSSRGGRKKDAPPARREGKALGRLLVSGGQITPKQLSAALATQRKTFLPLGRILRDEHHLGTPALAGALLQQTYIPRVYLRFFPVASGAVALLDPKFCEEHEVIAFERLGKMLCVALANPNREELISEIGELTERKIRPFHAPWEDIRRKLEQERE